jgi:HD superfamily phosphohydrolase
LSLASSIERFVDEQLSEYEPYNVRDRKLIRDGVVGSYLFHEHEINIIDLPFVQRLRRIHQTGLAFLTYPSAHHNRFEHSIGVLIIVDKIANALKKKFKAMFDTNTIEELRLAALLHDIGHGPFSHPSEEILIQLKDMQKALKDPKFSKAKPHEILSYMIITSKPFKDFFDDLMSKYHRNWDIQKIANMIIGNTDGYDREFYKADLINGAFDCDKLDYIPRDAHFSGLKMEVDLDRIMHTTLIDFRRGYPRRVCIDISGVHNVEQVLFNKVLLYSSIYHHHKIRAATCMLKSIFEIIYDYNIEFDGLNFRNSVDFLKIDDYDILSNFAKISEIRPIINNLKRRLLLKRALIISRRCIKNVLDYQRLIRFAEDPISIRELRELIVDEVDGICSVYEIWVDIPQPPSLREPSQCLVKVSKNKFVTLNKIFPADWWLTAYGETKLKGHVFAPPDNNIRKKVNEAAKRVFEEFHNIKFKKCATTEAKIFGS